jgi:hypothetical protein
MDGREGLEGFRWYFVSMLVKVQVPVLVSLWEGGYGEGCQLADDSLSYTPFTVLPVFISLVRLSLVAVTANNIVGFLSRQLEHPCPHLHLHLIEMCIVGASRVSSSGVILVINVGVGLELGILEEVPENPSTWLTECVQVFN